MRLLGVDVGTRRIGLAVSDTSATLATPLAVLAVSGTAHEAVDAVVREVALLRGGDDGLDGIVVGVPRNLDGTPTDATRSVLRLAAELGDRTSLPVHLQDERLTSVEAERRLARQEKDWRRRKARLDAAAAAVILQDYLDRDTVPDTGVESEEDI